MAQVKQKRSIEEYLAFERASDTKHEYFQGDVFAMAGGTARHSIITTNISASLHSQVRQRICTVYSSDMRVKVQQHTLYTYPDVSVVCGESQYEDEREDTLLNPTVIIEVLSPSTENYDRGKKSQFYRTIPSLQEYILVAQDDIHIEHFVRHSDHQWLFSETTLRDREILLASIDCSVALEDVYARISFDT